MNQGEAALCIQERNKQRDPASLATIRHWQQQRLVCAELETQHYFDLEDRSIVRELWAGMPRYLSNFETSYCQLAQNRYCDRVTDRCDVWLSSRPRDKFDNRFQAAAGVGQ